MPWSREFYEHGREQRPQSEAVLEQDKVNGNLKRDSVGGDISFPIRVLKMILRKQRLVSSPVRETQGRV